MLNKNIDFSFSLATCTLLLNITLSVRACLSVRASLSDCLSVRRCQAGKLINDNLKMTSRLFRTQGTLLSPVTAGTLRGCLFVCVCVYQVESVSGVDCGGPGEFIF